ncbi:hypothetical protein CLAFUW4_10774 [Fulvia fulva]|uniref:Uncharacterized protein n=1 Tax=Passalora fulva TaxID=5499 RepID=A0A9Q8URZ0_PASFU|nr:uncharacterized protein CLAFUR5_09817 [Fulvia fulva]KAK4619431.1 hypothetical protein CLAFUR4_10779 [Fulvia fulva]KAK4621044.1 hypothetical protein CLAFUR0_10786 [Fulvia fulva]UJO20304.1 hypothetical protein CLAFUR5_09817 [Fulvia fulva]WPV17492.1 hypothetical protein CLAFUW4_10774 [Fulvia fulva]
MRARHQKPSQQDTTKEPKQIQIDSLMGLIFGLSDTLLAVTLLNRLGVEQAEQIVQALIEYIIAEPEQLYSPAFLSLLREISNRVGAIIINKVFTVEQWVGFRPEFAQLAKIRNVLPLHIVFYGSTATLPRLIEDWLFEHLGLRPRGLDPYQTKVIRGSCDRPTISHLIKRISQEYLGDFDFLYFECDEAAQIGDDGMIEATPHKIPKTLNFVDSYKAI